MLRAIYTEAHTPLWLDTAERLRRDVSLEPCYWVGKAHVRSDVLSRFPGAVFHARTDAIRGVPPPELATLSQRPLDAEVLGRFSAQLLMAGKMMDRLDAGDGFRFEERTRLCHIQFRYWRAVLDRFRPDIVLFPVQPHTVYDYILYELCKSAGIATCMFQWTLFHDWLYPLDDIRDGYGEIRSRYERLLESDQDVVLPENVQRYLRQVNGDYRDAIPDYMVARMPSHLQEELFGRPLPPGDSGMLAQELAVPRRPKPLAPFPELRQFVTEPRRARKHLGRFLHLRAQHWHRQLRHARTKSVQAVRRSGQSARRLLETRSLKRGVRQVERTPRRLKKAVQRWYRRYFRMTVRALVTGDMNRPLKERGHRLEDSFRGRWGGLRLELARRAGVRKKKVLLREYLKRCQEPDFAAPFVFVALHYQPEQTTAPTGSVFVDQLVMIDMLARLVPDGWYVYVKEHPFQFYANSIGERSRSLEFYDDLLKYPNVRLVSWSVSPFELIDHARAVATISGTTGAEALMRGRPVLAFGYAWYRDCDGAFYTPDVESCRRALGHVSAGYRPDPRRVRVFLKAVEECCFRADLDFGVEIEPVPHEENVRLITGGIRRVFERHLVAPPRDTMRPA